jgi:hypothetical protein
MVVEISASEIPAGDCMSLPVRCTYLLGVLLVLGSCSRVEPFEPVVEPTFADVVRAEDGRDYTLAAGQIPTTALSESKWIGPEGGEVVLGGHSITVPVGAVSRSTLFTISVARQHIGVDLRARIHVGNGSVIDIGPQGFKKPIRLVLSFEYATNVQNPARLTVLHDPENGQPHQLMGGSLQADNQKSVAVELRHFSKYALGMD